MTSLIDCATELRADATRHLTALAGNASMCAIGRSGRSFPAAKFHEGRQAAAGEVRRALRRDPDADSETLQVITAEWDRALRDAEAKGPDWVAYASGGLDALAELAGS